MTWGVTMVVFLDSYLVSEGLSSILRTACKLGHWNPCFLSHSYWMASRATPLLFTDTHFTLTLAGSGGGGGGNHYFMGWETEAQKGWVSILMIYR